MPKKKLYIGVPRKRSDLLKEIAQNANYWISITISTSSLVVQRRIIAVTLSAIIRLEPCIENYLPKSHPSPTMGDHFVSSRSVPSNSSLQINSGHWAWVKATTRDKGRYANKDLMDGCAVLLSPGRLMFRFRVLGKEVYGLCERMYDYWPSKKSKDAWIPMKHWITSIIPTNGEVRSRVCDCYSI